MALIECKNLSLAYELKEVAHGINFTVEKGDYLSIVGENGSGKSTLIKCLLGLKSPFGGKIIYGDGLKQNNIGYLPQQATIRRDFPASVYEVVLSGCLNNDASPFYKKRSRNKAKEVLDELELTCIAKSCFAELSGGQQQRVLLARALCATTKLILLDEPVAGLDPLATNDFYELISKLNINGITVITVSHDICASVNHSDKILHMGYTPLFYGSVDDYVKTEAYKKIHGRHE